MGDTSIAWTDKSWNPVSGCSRVSEGCRNCYAEALSLRWGHTKKEWTARNAAENVVCHPDRLPQPVRWRKPARIFPSMCDPFHEQVPFHFLDRVFGVMVLAQACGRGHTFQFLTKRPERMLEYMTSRATAEEWADALAEAVRPHFAEGADCAVANSVNGVLGEGRNTFWPPQNVHLGVSVEDQKRADERIPLLLATPAFVRWLSCEPLLEAVDLSGTAGGTRWIGGQRGCAGSHHGVGSPECPSERHHHHDDRCSRGIDWVVVGGESGPGARSMHPEWARALRDQCRAAGVAYFMKQTGSVWARRLKYRNTKGEDPSEWPEDLRIREFPRLTEVSHA